MFKIGDLLYHPSNYDIIEFEVTGIHNYTGFNGETRTSLQAKATQNVGACGKVEVLINITISSLQN